MNARIFRKKTEDKTRYWVSVSNETMDGERIDATITARLSTKAAAVFNETAKKTKTDGIKTGYYQIDNSWLSAAKGEERNFVILFVNRISPAEVKQQKTIVEDDD